MILTAQTTSKNCFVYCGDDICNCEAGALSKTIQATVDSWKKPNMNEVQAVEEDALFKAHAAFDKAFYIDDLSSYEALRKAILAYEWSLEQPMETAPRDGTTILLYHDDFGWVDAYYAGSEGSNWYVYANAEYFTTESFKFWRPDLKQPMVKDYAND